MTTSAVTRTASITATPSTVGRNLREILPNVKPPKRGKNIMSKVAVTLLLALILAGTASAATQAEWTTKDAVAAAKALAYPRPHSRKTTCRGQGTAADGLYASFRCRSTYRHHRPRIFYLVDDNTGWVCAGAHVSGCRLLRKGFVAAAELERLGGFAQAVTYTAGSYVQTHYGGEPVGDGCTDSGSGKWSCVFSTPAVTVTVGYKKVRGGWTVTGTG